MDYTNFNVEDFASNESFIDWARQSDPEAVKFWDLYISSHPEIREKVEKARALVLNLKRAEEISYDPAQVESMWVNIQGRVEKQAKVSSMASTKAYWAVGAACFSLLCVVITWWFVLPGITGGQPLTGYHQRGLSEFAEQINDTDEPLKVELEDGSTVLLEAKSRLKYKTTFLNDSIRQVYLLGKAFFDVAKNPYKPFIVHSDEIVVKVLGTSFRVEAAENAENIRVSVKTGKVSVYAVTGNGDDHGQKDGVILLPNQQVSYERKEHLFSKSLVEHPEVLGMPNGVDITDFKFDNAPIAEVFRIMESTYGIEIIYNDEVMKNCYITAPFGSEPMQEKLRIICQTIGATYEIIDANVVINSSGCP
jgi:transmembrane sensor